MIHNKFLIKDLKNRSSDSQFDILFDNHDAKYKCRQKKLCGEEDCKRCGNCDVDEPCLGNI